MKKFKIIFFLFLFTLSLAVPHKVSAENTNTGFVSSNIWYSKDPFTDGDKIQIYTLLFNQDAREFSGQVAFYNRDTLLGKKNFVLKPQESSVVSLEWTVTAGTNTIYAKILDAKFSLGGGAYQEVVIAQNQSEKSQKIVIKKVSQDLEQVEETIKEKVTDILEPAKDIPEKILDSTPESISKPVLSLSRSVDSYRESGFDYFADKKEEAKKDIEAYNNQTEEKTTTEENENKEGITDKVEDKKNNGTYKPLKYLSLFFFGVLAFILNNKIIFYLILVSLVFSIVKFVWNKLT